MRKSADEIADVIRQRICQCPSGEDQILHEGLLAVEFGVSRTPIRQVLQKLAYEHLVETRSGVGTIVARLDDDARSIHTAAFRAMLKAAAEAGPDQPLPIEVRIRVESFLNPSASGASADDWYFFSMSGLLSLCGTLIADRILADAVRAAFWRHIRWRMNDRAEARYETEQALRSTLEGLPVSGSVPEFLHALAGGAM